MTPHSPEACARAGIPYTPEWRERVEGRLSSMEIEQRMARRRLAQNEPEHSRLEREKALVAREHKRAAVDAYAYRDVTIEQWRAHWRSLPDYDGPPMRSPSGVEFEELRSGRLCVFGYRTHKKESGWFRGANKSEGMADPDLYFGPRVHLPPDAEYVLQGQRWGVVVASSREQLFARPSDGGHGWCSKLAESE